MPLHPSPNDVASLADHVALSAVLMVFHLLHREASRNLGVGRTSTRCGSTASPVSPRGNPVKMPPASTVGCRALTCKLPREIRRFGTSDLVMATASTRKRILVRRLRRAASHKLRPASQSIAIMTITPWRSAFSMLDSRHDHPCATQRHVEQLHHRPAKSRRQRRSEFHIPLKNVLRGRVDRGWGLIGETDDLRRDPARLTATFF